MPRKVSQRTLTVFKHAMIGFGLGMVPVVLSVMPPAPVDSQGALIGSIIGGALAGALFLASVGAYRARSIPADRPSRVGRLRLILGVTPLALILLGLLVLMVI
ncbi:hypothetical protein [Azospirillum sp. B4]|uniref:hypothetical protein n=1 Tax=Azospirillum sp. B4 TaxID=95605 RepID=UPI000345DDEF|nr:hypothetical protein [Azospirillum sp. B4]